MHFNNQKFWRFLYWYPYWYVVNYIHTCPNIGMDYICLSLCQGVPMG